MRAEFGAEVVGCFNPHSPLLANEFAGCSRGACGEIVSIHIRHCWRMNSDKTMTRSQTLISFNPHSPLLANEFTKKPHSLVKVVVSIHIRHCWRMNSCNSCSQSCCIHVSIHIRHCWRMNSHDGRTRNFQTGFQSTFAIAGE